MGSRRSWKTGRFVLFPAGEARSQGLVDPRWANPIRDRVKQANRIKAMTQTINPSLSAIDAGALGPLRVVNGMSTQTSSSLLTTAARENIPVTSFTLDGLPGRPGNSTIRWGGGLQTHLEVQENENGILMDDTISEPLSKKFVTPSLATLEKAVSTRIFFENLYFPLLRQPPSREQRRLAMEKDMAEMQLSHSQKETLRSRWRQNETDYLRDRRTKVDVSAFIKLKTIGHG